MLGVLVARAARHVGEDLGRQRRLGARLQRRVGERQSLAFAAQAATSKEISDFFA